MQTETVFPTKQLLRPKQVEDTKLEIRSMEHRLANEKVEDKAALMRQLQRVRLNFETQVPRQPEAGSSEEAAMIARSDELLKKILPQMCSQEEMRKAPPGAVEKYMRGEGSPQTKKHILEWKNLQLRLRPGEADAPNLERFRPTASSLNMDNAAVTTKTIFMPPADAGLTTTFTNEQIAMIRSLDPKTADMLALMPNESRAEVKNIITKKKLSPAQLEALAKGRAARKKNLEAKK